MVCASRESARTRKRIRAIFETTKDCVRCYLKGKRGAIPNRELIRAGVNLAQFDLAYRIGLLDLQPIKDAMVEDTRFPASASPTNSLIASRRWGRNRKYSLALASLLWHDYPVMFEQLKNRWKGEKRSQSRRTVYRIWIGTALIFLVYVIRRFAR